MAGHASGNVGLISNFSFPQVELLVFAIVITSSFFIFFGHTSIWYDEANYLVLSAAIKETGYPLSFIDPDRPSIFLNSPPGLFYVISVLSRFCDDLFFLRSVYSTLFVILPFIMLLVYIRKQSLELFFLSVTALYCSVTWYYIIELVQIRMDLPLASLSFSALALVALAEDQLKQRAKGKLTGSTHRFPRLTLMLLSGVSALSFLTKFQAVCLTGTLILNVLLARQDFRKLASWLPLIAHLTGAAIGMFVLALWVMSNPVMPGIDVLTYTLSDNLKKIVGPHFISFNELERIFIVVQNTIPMLAVPTVVFVIARYTGSIDWNNDRLLRLCVLMTIVVVAFNIAVHRTFGAGNYYMAQAAIPLGYIFARSFGSLFQITYSRAALLALVSLLTFHAISNVRWGLGSPQRWDYGGLRDLVGATGRLDAPKLVAAKLAPFLQPEDVLLLDRWQSQSLAVPYWLKRSDRYGYLLDMDPIKAKNVLERQGPGRVGALVFFDQSQTILASDERWSSVEALLARDFVRSPQIPNAPSWMIYLRRIAGSRGVRFGSPTDGENDDYCGSNTSRGDGLKASLAVWDPDGLEVGMVTWTGSPVSSFLCLISSHFIDLVGGRGTPRSPILRPWRSAFFLPH